MRLTSHCTAAPNTPNSMVPAASTATISRMPLSSTLKIRVNTRRQAYTPTLVSSPAKIAETVIDAVW